MTGYDHTNDTNHPAVTQVGTPAAELTPLVKAKNLIVNGSKIMAIGVVGLVLAVLGMVAVAGREFPFDRIVAFLILLFLVVTAVVAIRGLVWLIQGLLAYAKAPK